MTIVWAVVSAVLSSGVITVACAWWVARDRVVVHLVQSADARVTPPRWYAVITGLNRSTNEIAVAGYGVRSAEGLEVKVTAQPTEVIGRHRRLSPREIAGSDLEKAGVFQAMSLRGFVELENGDRHYSRAVRTLRRRWAAALVGGVGAAIAGAMAAINVWAWSGAHVGRGAGLVVDIAALWLGKRRAHRLGAQRAIVANGNTLTKVLVSLQFGSTGQYVVANWGAVCAAFLMCAGGLIGAGEATASWHPLVLEASTLTLLTVGTTATVAGWMAIPRYLGGATVTVTLGELAPVAQSSRLATFGRRLRQRWSRGHKHER